jgi:ATP-binding cassette, subfamily B, bacterial
MLSSLRGSFAQTVSTTRWVIGLYFKASPKLSFVFVLGTLVDPIFNIFWAYLLGVVIDQVLRLIQSGTTDASQFLPFLVLLVVTDLAAIVLNTSSRFSQRIINRKLDFDIRRMLQLHLQKLGVAKLESPDITNRSQRFTEQVPGISEHMSMTISLVSDVVGIFGSLFVILSIIPEIVPFYLVVIILSALANQEGLRKLWLMERDTTEQRRAFWTTSGGLTDPNSLKELLLTGGHSLLRKKYEEFADYILDTIIAIRRTWLIKSIGTKLLQVITFGAGFWLLLNKALQGAISVGTLTFQIRMLNTFSSNMNALLTDFVNLRESTVKIADAKELFEVFATDEDGEDRLEESKKPVTIELQNVSFAYPNSKGDVIKNISLTIKAGEKVAIIGENGAGKTTLVKLLSRIYRASSGEVLIDGIDINKVKISSWYKKMGILFQDYNTYGHLTLRENVTIGDTSKKINDDAVHMALQKAHAADFTSKYEKGLDQVLSERYKGGIRPSTGQWQKIAIARFFYRDAPVLILDEPTAAIDAVAEAQIFDNIYKFIKNKTVIIISHRFSTVRSADRIIVLHDGAIAEEGTHEELLKLNGRYAKSFNLQARGYN